MPEYIIYRAKAVVLTPLHIGSGRELLYEYDYAVYKGHTWRLNEESLLDTKSVSDPFQLDMLMRTPPARLLKPDDFQWESQIFRYVLRGAPRSREEGARLQEQLKDPYDQPYLPGSSLKGALRTSLAWYGWKVLKLRPERTNLNPNPRFAARQYERMIFGPDPKHDLLRALHVVDSDPVGTDRIMVVNVRVLHCDGKLASPIELESISPDTELYFTVKLDIALFSEWAKRHGLKLRGESWLRDLPNAVNLHAAQRLKEEREWYDDVPGAKGILNFYRRKMGIPKRGFLLQVGWGTGWDDKTFGNHLRDDTYFLEGILKPRRSGGYGIARGSREPGDPFPKSRRVVMAVQHTPDGGLVERPAAPLGWLWVREWEPMKQH